jgi:trehalose-phosphatase
MNDLALNRELHNAWMHGFSTACDIRLVFDYDGTLVNHHPKPMKALMSDQQLSNLRALTNHVQVSILSGRPYSELKQLIPIDSVQLLGEYGYDTGMGCAKSSAAIAQLQHRIELIVQANGYAVHRLEAKRSCVNLEITPCSPQSMQALSLAFQKEASHWHVRLGKFGFDISETPLPSKWNAFRKLCNPQLELMLFAGDDTPDEEVFANVSKSVALDHVLTIKVGSYTPDSFARLTLATPNDLHFFIEASLKSRTNSAHQATHI